MLAPCKQSLLTWYTFVGNFNKSLAGIFNFMFKMNQLKSTQFSIIILFGRIWQMSEIWTKMLKNVLNASTYWYCKLKSECFDLNCELRNATDAYPLLHTLQYVDNHAIHFPITSCRMILLRPFTSYMQPNRYAEHYTNKYMCASIFYLFMHRIWKPDTKNDKNWNYFQNLNKNYDVIKQKFFNIC